MDYTVLYLRDLIVGMLPKGADKPPAKSPEQVHQPTNSALTHLMDGASGLAPRMPRVHRTACKLAHTQHTLRCPCPSIGHLQKEMEKKRAELASQVSMSSNMMTQSMRDGKVSGTQYIASTHKYAKVSWVAAMQRGGVPVLLSQSWAA